ncbi:hypothetical protein [Kineosporia sp. R_H_3]|uniref:hypothetical protein n=1 Tax=Kineosporia sp. R_H_3 TaxID=1961848 RepID=UPI000B4AC6D9|nr:hypothetical protein [Kineosporia sp. R_H_3]
MQPAADAPQVVGRLGRFDGTTFAPVVEGEVDAAVVHVFVHGWMPGFRTRERLLAATDGVRALHAWDPRLVDPDGRPLVADYTPLLEALHGLGPDHAVLWYSWIDESATDADVLLAHRSRQATQINGRRLAVALQRALARRPGRHGRLHLLGHSHGSAVVTHAAASLRRPPDHLTFLDAPENQLTRIGGAADLIDAVLPRLHPGRERGRVFVDSYTSMFGGPYHRRPGLAAVVDVSLTPPLTATLDPVRAVTAAHLYAVDWYARSVRELQRGVGYGWSPLVTEAAPGGPGPAVADLHPWYTAPLALRPLDVRRRPELPLAATAGRLARRSQVRHRPLEGARLAVTPAAPDAALSFTTAPGDQLLEFDLSVHGGDGGEQLDLAVDGVAAFRSLTRYPVPMSGRYVMLADGRPGEHLLTARLTSRRPPLGRRAGDDAARPVTVHVTNLRLVNTPGAAAGFSPTRTMGAAFVAGAASGSLVTLVTLVATGWTARRVLAALTRRRAATAAAGSRPRAWARPAWARRSPCPRRCTSSGTSRV